MAGFKILAGCVTDVIPALYPHLRLTNFGVKRDREGQEENQDDDEEVNW